jgi:uncharacterized NAD(P)/FAD-binding protein YdhS
LKNDGLIIQDELMLGVEVNKYYQIIDVHQKVEENMYAIGSLLKGRLWESTAINELRAQAKEIAEQLINQISKS